MTPTRLKRCRQCREKFAPMNSMQIVCSPSCALALVRVDAAKRERASIRERNRALKSRAEWMRNAQKAFNLYIRSRDADLPCISCGDFTPMTRGGDYDCGHYRSVGANPELRFVELNAAKQCKRCNSHLSGNVVNYRIGLLMRVGEENLAWLEGPHEPKKHTIDDLKQIMAEYRAKTKALKTDPVYPVAGVR